MRNQMFKYVFLSLFHDKIFAFNFQFISIFKASYLMVNKDNYITREPWYLKVLNCMKAILCTTER